MGRRGAKKIIRRYYALLLPAVVILVFLFGGGLIFAFIRSIIIYSSPSTDISSILSKGLFASYRYILSDVSFYKSLGLTIVLSTITTAVSVIAGVAIALLIRHAPRSNILIRFAYQLPVAVPHVVVAICVFLLLTQSGFIARIFYAVGAIDGPGGFPPFVSDRFGIGIVVAYLWKEIPFIALIALSALQGIGDNYEAIARTLGAGRGTVIRRVLLPLISPSVTPATIIVFAFMFGSYEIPALLGRSYPSLLAVLSYRYYSSPELELRPVAMALNILITGIVLICAYLYLQIGQRIRRA